MPSSVAESFRLTILHKLETVAALLERVPADELDWRPDVRANARPPLTLGALTGHLLECAAGVCAVLHAVSPHERFETLRGRSRDACHPDDVRRELGVYREAIDLGFQALSDPDLSRVLPSLFSTAGETTTTLLLENVDHLTNHTFQLFFYLRLMGLDVGTPELYGLDAPPKRNPA